MDDARRAFAHQVHTTIHQHGEVLSGAGGAQALGQRYRHLADQAVGRWGPGQVVHPETGQALLVQRDRAVALAGDVVHAVPGAEQALLEDVVRVGVPRPGLAVAVVDAVLVYGHDHRGRVTETVVPLAHVVAADPVVVAVGPARPGVQLVWFDHAGDYQVVVLGVAGFSDADVAGREQVRDVFLAHVVEQALERGAALDEDDDSEDEDEDDGGWDPGPSWAPAPTVGGGTDAGLVAALVVAGLLVLVLVAVLTFVLLSRGSG